MSYSLRHISIRVPLARQRPGLPRLRRALAERILPQGQAHGRNIDLIADEAHRGQYDFIDGFARHMRYALPHASFVGFTGTPIEKTDANTRAVFGDTISVYDIQRAVADGATVPIYYESRLALRKLPNSRPCSLLPSASTFTDRRYQVASRFRSPP